MELSRRNSSDQEPNAAALPPPGRSRRLAYAFLLGTVASALLIIATSRGDVDRMVFGDGAIHQYVSQHLTTRPADIDPAIVQAGTALRYGRIGLPAILWAASGGSAEAARFAQPALMALSGGLMLAGVVALVGPMSPLGPAVVLLAPGVALSLAGGFAEGPALALSLWALLAALRGREWESAGLFAGAILSKESAVFILVAAVLWSYHNKRGTRALVPLASLLPVAWWYLFVWERFGDFPLLDPYTMGPRGAGLPFIGLFRSLTDPASIESLLVALLHVGIAFAVAPFLRRSVFALGATVASIALLFTTPFTPWAFIGDGFRTSVFIEVFAILTLVTAKEWRRSSQSAAARAFP